MSPKIFFVDVAIEPRGVRIADITTRLELAVLVPRGELVRGGHRWELDHPGVCFLFGEDEDGAKDLVYLGRTEDARKRLDSHNKPNTFWTTALSFSKEVTLVEKFFHWRPTR